MNVSQLTIQQNKLHYNVKWTNRPVFYPHPEGFKSCDYSPKMRISNLQSPKPRFSLATKFAALKQRRVLTVKTSFLPIWEFVQNLFLRTSSSA